MELGVDIASSTSSNMRNVPPTPANYAQRSGRAGRRGQPALVFTYCSTGSPHDQYFFRRPDLMVAGQVHAAAPRPRQRGPGPRPTSTPSGCAEAGLSLGPVACQTSSTSAVTPPTLALLHRAIRTTSQADSAPQPSPRRAHGSRLDRRGLDGSRTGGRRPGSTTSSTGAPPVRRACDRWRDLYRAADSQQAHPERDHPATPRSPPTTRREPSGCGARPRPARAAPRRGQTDIQSDFYSYRYFASEGFLPGYSFPRLPLSAFIPGAPRRQGADELPLAPAVPRDLRVRAAEPRLPRRLALRDQPGHPAGASDRDEPSPSDHARKLCATCGYLHPVERRRRARPVPSAAARRSSAAMDNLFRLQNVVDPPAGPHQLATRRSASARAIEIRTASASPSRRRPSRPTARRSRRRRRDARHSSPTARRHLWRINMGWRRRARTRPSSASSSTSSAATGPRTSTRPTTDPTTRCPPRQSA